METVFRVLDVVFRLLLGGVFIYAAWSKIQDPALFASAIVSYRLPLPGFVVSWTAMALPMVELVAGSALIVTCWSRESALILLVLILLFLMGLTQAWARGLEISCGCFGEADEQTPLWVDIVRDLVLLLPAGWLVYRPNGCLGGRRVARAVLVFSLMAAGTSIALETNVVAEMDPSSEKVAGVMPERWTRDFPLALERARATGRPLMMITGKRGCAYCKRMKDVLSSGAFQKWVEGTGIYLAEAHFDETNASPAQAEQIKFLLATPHDEKLTFPHLGIYWPRATNEEVRSVFSWRRGRLPGAKHPTMTGEFVNAMDVVLGDYLKTLKNRPTRDEILATNVKQIRGE